LNYYTRRWETSEICWSVATAKEKFLWAVKRFILLTLTAILLYVFVVLWCLL
jgi:hypothetical protein